MPVPDDASARRHRKVLAAAAGLLIAAGTPALAALPTGQKAPDFTAQASQGGKEFNFSLANALRRGPVVVYFYPAAFTKGCTVEAHDFAEATDEFRKLGATVIGVSEDDIATLDRFSVSECQSRFPVAADQSGKVAGAYDALLKAHPGHADRTSYAIAPDGRILASYTAMDPDGHVDRMLDAVRHWRAVSGAKTG
ncbi:peroxiredoxin [Rhizosaccharibacter radicis]|uniref:thioredoxin-dependent peroxiredoxin n=1 Tax=Rhizosaccharibacter radicis TaxID=2782605 RepID=A0ABT1W0H2_9PROT|nr:peroxiredoxin [Acetobacteraceae bacterium KSS12]